MATELNNAGFQIVQITSVHDDAAHIKKALDEALGRAQVVLITGGLGPTKDDITKQTLCDYFNTRLVFDEKVLQNIRELYHTRQNVMNELTRSQAMVPENSIVIQSLNHLRNAMLRENRDTGCLDELLLKVMCAPVKKM